MQGSKCARTGSFMCAHDAHEDSDTLVTTP